MQRIARVVGTALGTTVGCGAVLAELLHLTGQAWSAVSPAGPARPADVVVAVAATAALLLATWLVLGLLVSVLAHLPGRVGRRARAWSSACAPALVRRLVAGLLGATLGGALSPVAALGSAPADGPPPGPGFVATTTDHPVPRAVATTGPGFTATTPTPAPRAPRTTTAGPGWVPTRPQPATSPDLVVGSRSRSRAPTAAEVTVRRGDSLWSIAAHHLGPGATDTEVAEAWPHWYTANRDTIGADPDRLVPGQRLRVPTHEVAR